MLKIIRPEDNQKELKKLFKQHGFSDKPREKKQVQAIIEAVKTKGDKAVLEYNKKFSRVKLEQASLRVSKKEIKDAYTKVSDDFFRAFSRAVDNITAFHHKQKPKEWFNTLPHDVFLGQRAIPLDSVGVYVPGGRAPYVSTVVMNVVPAKVAGVKRIVLVSPAPIDPHILVAANELEVTEIYEAGGAQAVAALAYGTKTIAPVNKIVGPGNLYVTLAKQQVYGTVGIDSLAGPSDVLIIADHDANPAYLASDLLAQAEHDPNSQAILLTDSAKIIKAMAQEINKQKKQLKRKKIIEQAKITIFKVKNINEAIEISNQIGPEHLELQIDSPQKALEKIHNAGAVFLGPDSPVVVGDYIAGPNHVLPTGGAAKFSSPLGVYDFVKNQSIIAYTQDGLKSVAQDVAVLTEIEGLDGHNNSLKLRLAE